MSPVWSPYQGHTYHDYHELEQFCEQAAAAFPQWLRLEHYGRSRLGRPLLLLTLHVGPEPAACPAFWVDAGTHASEWAGVMAVMFSLSRWLEQLQAGEPTLTAFLSTHTAYLLPCLSPDGFQYMWEGGPYVRSSLRPAREWMRPGLEPQDVDGDGEVLWMRWKHPAGPWVQDEHLPMLLRPRRLDDAPESAYFACSEGLFHQPELSGPVQASAAFGLDLNRNFPVSWVPFSQFGMDGGAYSLSEPESRACLDALAARPNVCAVITHHTYTGALLTPPYRPDSPLSGWDLDTLYRLGLELIGGTGYRIFRVYPEFQYEPGKNIPGSWADFLSAVWGIPAYTLELWDPYGFAGVELKEPARAFFNPDMEGIRKVAEAFSKLPDTWKPWTAVEHPQLGPVEVGGLREHFTIRNPPPSKLREELERAHTVVERMRQALPEVRLQATLLPAEGLGPEVFQVTAECWNHGYLGTWGLPHAEKQKLTETPSLTLELEGLSLVQGVPLQHVPHLSGWGDAPGSFRPHPFSPMLANVGPRLVKKWLVQGQGSATVRWSHTRGGVHEVRLSTSV
ncbi:MAG: M14 family zinc carboxypeptidase [Myxococcota bacterium]